MTDKADFLERRCGIISLHQWMELPLIRKLFFARDEDKDKKGMNADVGGHMGKWEKKATLGSSSSLA